MTKRLDDIEAAMNIRSCLEEAYRRGYQDAIKAITKFAASTGIPDDSPSPTVGDAPKAAEKVRSGRKPSGAVKSTVSHVLQRVGADGILQRDICDYAARVFDREIKQSSMRMALRRLEETSDAVECNGRWYARNYVPQESSPSGSASNVSEGFFHSIEGGRNGAA